MKKFLVKLHDEEEIELDASQVQFYKIETKKNRVTQKGLEKFFKNLITSMYSHLLF